MGLLSTLRAVARLFFPLYVHMHRLPFFLCKHMLNFFLMFILAKTCMCFPFIYLRNFLFLCISTYAVLESFFNVCGGILFMHISLFLCAYFFAVIVCFVLTYWWSSNLAWLSSSIRLFYHDFLIFVLCLLWVLC